MNLVEMKQSVDMLYDEWDLGKTPSHSKGKVCAWIYLFEILEETEKMVIEKENGKGIGKKMLSQVFEYAKNDNMKNIQILTDESCNFKFYEACGCNKVYEKVINNGEPDKCGNTSSEIGYIYEKRLGGKDKEFICLC